MSTTNKSVVAATLFIGVVSLATLIIIEHYRKRTRKAPPLVRDTFKTFLDNYVEGKHHWFQLKSSRETGPVFRLPIPQLIPTVALVVTDATLARLILEGDNNYEEHDKSFAYRGMKGITLGVNTMVTKRTHHEGWDWSRKAVASSFSNTNLHRLLPALQLQLKFFGVILDAHAEQKKTFDDLASWMVRLTMDFLARSMFHADFGSLQKHSIEMGLIQGDHKAIESDGGRLILQLGVAVKEYAMMQAMIPFRKYMFWNEEVHAGLRAAKELQSIGQKVLDKYRAEHSDEELKDDKTIIAHLLRSPYPSNRERVADVTTFLLAGHDTTGYQISWILIEISRNPSVLLKIRSELDLLIIDNAPFTAQLLSQMKYLTMVIREGMRLWPVLPIGSNRVASRDIQYKEFVIPRGSTLAIGNFAMFRSGIRQPDDFIPERWADDDADAAALKEMNIPFSTGKRSCVGQNLALLELKLVLAFTMHSYDFKLVSEIQDFYFLSLKPMNANFEVSRRVRQTATDTACAGSGSEQHTGTGCG